MLSDIPATWPPAPGLNQTDTGHRTELVTDFQSGYGVRFAGLHETAWWTGIQITATEPAAAFNCLMVVSGEQGDYCIGEWTLQSGDWSLLTWPIPAAMGERVAIFIHRVDSGAPLSNVAIRLGFHELSTLQPDDRFLFVDTSGAACMTWISSQQEVSLRTGGGSPPQFERVYTVIPMMRRLVFGQPWDNEAVFCLHSWNETVPVA